MTTKRITSFHPPRRTLLGPGPSDMNPRVMTALAQPAIGYLDPAFVTMMEELKELDALRLPDHESADLPALRAGSVGMEACFVNLVEPGDKVIVCRNGVFGGRMIENVERGGGTPVILEETWGEPIEPQKWKTCSRPSGYEDRRLLCTPRPRPARSPDAQALCDIARRPWALTIVDCVTSLGGTPVLLDAWQADATYSGSQKCLSCTPGLSPVSYSERAIEKVKVRTKGKVQSWFMDLNLVLAYWGETARTYHHTAPGNSLYGLHEALLLLKEEGLENAWARHRRNHGRRSRPAQRWGWTSSEPEAARLPQLNSVYIPDGIDDSTVRKTLLNDYNIEIGAGLGPLAGKIWRFGLMGLLEPADQCAAAALGAIRGAG